MAGTLDQQQATTNTDQGVGSANGNLYCAQSVTVGLAGTIDHLELQLYKVGSPGNLSVEIWTESSGVPGSKVSDTTTFDPSSLGASPGAFVEISITNGGTYAVSDKFCIVCIGNAVDASNYVGWRLVTPSGYAGGQGAIDNNGAGWTPLATVDFGFKTYMLSEASGYKNMLLMGVG